jgi:putative ABC transport system permease protein
MHLFRPLWQQSVKSSGIYLLLIALVVAISTTTALKFSNQQIQNAVALQAAELLAADLVLSDQAPLAKQWRTQAQQYGLTQSEVTSFSSMAHTDAEFVMVNVKAIQENYPLRGQLQANPAQHSIQAGQIWLSPRAQDLLKVQLGDWVNIADAKLKFTAVIAQDSNQELGLNGFSPSVLMHQQDVAKTNAIQVGSRIEYRLLLAGTFKQIQAFEQKVHPQIKAMQDQQTSSLRLRHASESNGRLMRPLENLETFLQLANILTILLCGLAIALTSQRYVEQQQEHIALLRCLGAAKRQILNVYLTLLAIIFVLAVVLGAALGVLMGMGLLQLMLSLMPHLKIEFSVFSLLLGPLPTAMLTSLMVLMGFVLPSIWRLLQTAPIQVLRAENKSVAALPSTLIFGSLSLLIFSVVLTQNVSLSVMVIAALLVLCVVLYTITFMALRILQQRQNALSAYIRQIPQMALQVTALALGLSLMSVLMVLKTDLTERWQQQLPADTPNQFVYGLPPTDLSDFQAVLEQQHWSGTALYPNIRGRLIAKNGQAFTEEERKKSNTLRRELNLTQAATFPQDNQIIEGQTQFTAANQVSVEVKTAQELGIHIGDRLKFSLPEGDLTAQVVNLRSVEWESFSPNFFFIFTPNSMDANAGSYLGSFYVPDSDQHKLVEVIQQFSNTVFIDVGLMLNEVKRLLDVLLKIISVLAVLVSVAGILVLLACLNLMLDARRQEVALLRAFGGSKAQLKRMLTLEIGFIGLCAGLSACVLAEVMSMLISYKMGILWQWHPQIWLLLPLVMALLCGLIGRYRLSYLADIAPLTALRDVKN